MYETYWNLKEKPFRNIIDKKFFFYAETYEEAYLRLLYNVGEAQGVFLLLGQSGCGKSLVAKLFMQDMLEQGYRVALIKNPAVAPHEFLQQILYECGITVPNLSKLEMLKELKKIAESGEGKNYILLIDEAHLIQDMNTWEEIRLLSDLEDKGNNRLCLLPILIGKPEIKDILAKTNLKGRIGLQYQIRPFNCRETGEYIYYRMEKAGAMREIFTADAVKEIYTATRGIPRDINNVCDLALLLGYGDNAIVIERALILKAMADLRGTPQPLKK